MWILYVVKLASGAKSQSEGKLVTYRRTPAGPYRRFWGVKGMLAPPEYLEGDATEPPAPRFHRPCKIYANFLNNLKIGDFIGIYFENSKLDFWR